MRCPTGPREHPTRARCWPADSDTAEPSSAATIGMMRTPMDKPLLDPDWTRFWQYYCSTGVCQGSGRQEQFSLGIITHRKDAEIDACGWWAVLRYVLRSCIR